MPIISAKVIKKPKKTRACETCGQLIVGPTIRLYGHASSCDKPWVMYCCPSCLKETKDSKIQKALEEINENQTV